MVSDVLEHEECVFGQAMSWSRENVARQLTFFHGEASGVEVLAAGE